MPDRARGARGSREDDCPLIVAVVAVGAVTGNRDTGIGVGMAHHHHVLVHVISMEVMR